MPESEENEAKNASESCPDDVKQPEGKPIIQQYFVNENAGEWKWNIYWVVFFVIILPIIIAVKLKFTFPFLFNSDLSLTSGPVSQHVYRVFQEYDVDKDGYLTPFEFQTVFFAIKAGSVAENINLTEVEKENFQKDVKTIIQAQTFDNTEEILNLKAVLDPMDLKTMKKFKEESMTDPEAMFHLHGLSSWLSPHIESANFSVSNFTVLLPLQSSKVVAGSTWELIPKVLAGASGGGIHLAHYRYLPPNPSDAKETLLLYLMSMLGKRPFLHMRFPPRGVVACLRAVNEEYYNIMFRFHPEFQLNEPPRFPFWFTPASVIGDLIIKKDGSHIEYLKMHVPNHRQLNVDMEWITGTPEPKDNGTVNDAHGQEVDIGYVSRMEIESTQPSTVPSNIKHEGVEVASMKWDNEITVDEAYDIMGKEFYPFKKIPYIPFNKTFSRAEEEGKIIHHILLWGSLDDQSC